MSTPEGEADPSASEERPARVAFPEEVGDEDLARHFALSEDDLAFVRQSRGDHNRIGFALQLAHVRWKGRFATAFERVAPLAVNHIASQLGLATPPSVRYPERERTRWDHTQAIRTYLGLRPWRPGDAEKLRDALVERALELRLPERDLLNVAEKMVHQNRILLPGATVLRHVARRALGLVEDVAVGLISKRLSEQLGARLDEVLLVPKGQRVSGLQELKKYPGRATPKTIKSLCERVAQLRGRGVEDLDLEGIQPERVLDFSERTRNYYARPLARFRPAKRRALLACFLHETMKDATDGAVRVFERVVQRMQNKAEKESKREARLFRELARGVAEGWVTAGAIISTYAPAPEKIGPLILADLPTARVESLLLQANQILESTAAAVIARLAKKAAYVKKITGPLFDTVRFHAGPEMQDLMTAVTVLATAHREHRRTLPGDVPVTPRVVPNAWRQLVLRPEGGVYPGPYQVCVAVALKAAIASGEVFVKGSRKYVPISTLLYPDATWHERQADKRNLLPEDPEEVLSGLEAQLGQAVRITEAGLADNPFASCPHGRLQISKEPAETETNEVKAARNAISAHMQPVGIEQLMAYVDQRTNLAEVFEPPPGYDVRLPLPARRRATHAGILALATGLGLWSMGRMARGINYAQLAHVADWALTELLLAAANDHLVNAHHAHPLAKVYGPGKRSSSDGIRFGVRVSKLLSEPNPKYFGWGEGLTSYKAMSDQWSIFSTQLITCHESEAMRMLGALLSNRTTLPLGGGHAADTAAASHAAFALCNLSGLPFWPRRADLHKVRFWRFDRKHKASQLEPLFAGVVDIANMRREWDNLRRLLASLRDGVAPAHIIGRTMSAAVQHDPLARAVDDFGKIYATIYYLQYLASPELRRAVRRLLARHESQNGLGRAIILGARGELRAPDQEVAAATLFAHTLLQTMVLFYNTCHYHEMLPQLRADGIDVRPEVLADVSPLLFRHINFRGTYDFTLSGAKTPAR